MVVAFLAGIVLGNYRASFELAGQGISQQLVGQTVILRGKISEDPVVDIGQTTLRLNQLQLQDRAESVNIAGALYVRLSHDFDFERSDIVTIQGKFAAGFGTFVGSMYRPELVSVERAQNGDIFARLKQWFAGAIRTYIAAPASELGLGYLMGLKSGFSDELSEKLRLVGMTHVVVASGAHLGILVAVARKLLGRISRFAGLLGAVLLLIAFVLLVGGTPSMTRAALVTLLSLGFGYVGRKFTPWRLIIFVAMLTLLIAPTNFLNLGWQLSFASFFGLLILAPRLTQLLYGGRKPIWLASMLLTSAATLLICAPILIYNFGSLSLLSLLANLIILPTLPYAMLLVFLTGIMSFIMPLAKLCAFFTTWLLNLHLGVINFLSTQTAFVLNLPAENPLVFLWYLGILILLGAPRLRQFWRKQRKYGIMKA